MKIIGKNMLIENRYKIIIATIYNLVLTMGLFLLFFEFLGPILEPGFLPKGMERIGSILTIMTGLLAFQGGALLTHANYRRDNRMDFLKTMEGSADRFYLREISGVSLALLFEMVISAVLLIIVAKPLEISWNIFLLILYLVLTGIFFLNIGNLVGYFSKRSALNISALPLVIIVLFLISGSVIPLVHFDNIYALILYYLPTGMILSGTDSILAGDFNALLIPLIYFVVLDLITVFVTRFVLNLDD